MEVLISGRLQKWGKRMNGKTKKKFILLYHRKEYTMSCLHNEILLEKWYEEALQETLKEYKDVEKAEEEAEKIARDRLERESE